MGRAGTAVSRSVFFALVGAVGIVAAQDLAAPDVPESLKTPAGESIVLRVHAEGVQIYTCGVGADGKYVWTFKAPKAQLFDKARTLVGEHFAGPTWKLDDGSEVSGKVSAKQDAPDSDSIPWLLITVTGHNGAGLLEKVTTIQRIHTRGGVVDTAMACDATNKGSESERPYSADYYFYAPKR